MKRRYISMFTLISAGFAPGFALLSYFYLRDKYETEPIGMMIKTFVMGMVIVFPAMLIQYAFNAEQSLQGNLTHAFFLSGGVEEFLKWCVVMFIAFRHPAFNERYDGIVYAVSVSLGFATIENILYLYDYGLHFALLRALLPVSSHALFGVLMGYYIGKAKFADKKGLLLIFSLIVPVIFHGFYDYFMKFQSSWMYIIIPFMIVLWWYALRKVKHAHQQHQEWLKYHHTKNGLK